MKARLVSNHDSIYLLNSFGESQRVSSSSARDFLLNFSNEKYCGNTSAASAKFLPALGAEGIVIAEVDDNGILLIKHEALFRDIILKSETEFLSVQEYANLHGKGVAMVRRLCQNRRIHGAVQVGSVYIIPANAPYPKGR